MRRVKWTGLLLILALMIPVASGAQQTKAQKFRDEAMLAKLLLKYREFKTLTQTVQGKMQVKMDGVAFAADIHSVVQMGQPNRFRFDTKIAFFGKERQGTTYSNGETVWEWDEDGKQYSEQPFSPIAKNEDKFTDWLMSRTNADLTPLLFLQAANSKGLGLPPGASKSIEVRDYPTKQVEGRAMYVIPVPINEADGTKGMASLYVDPQDMLVYRCRFQIRPPREKKGPKNLTVDYILNFAEISPNAELTDEAFTFTPPEGAKKVKAVKPVFDRAFD